MSEVVITAIGRTPIGRAAKGSLIDQRPDDLGAYVADEVLKQIPQLRAVFRLATLLNDLRTRNQAIGLETMCVGGGQGMAMVVERLS